MFIYFSIAELLSSLTQRSKCEGVGSSSRVSGPLLGSECLDIAGHVPSSPPSIGLLVRAQCVEG